MFKPGATTWGKMPPSQPGSVEGGGGRKNGAGPRLLKDAMVLLMSVAPTAKEPTLLAGLTLVEALGPEFPAEKITSIPAAFMVFIEL